MDVVEACKVQIAPIEKVNGARFEEEFVEEIDLVNFAVSNENERGNAAPQIHKCMKLDSPLAMTKFCPGENRKAKVDRAGIEGVNGFFQFYPEIFVGIKSAGVSNQDLGEVAIDAPVADLIGVGQGVARDLSTEAHVIEFLLTAP